MLFSHLQQIAIYLQQHKKIAAIYRIGDNLIKIVFDNNKIFYFDMRKSQSTIFKTSNEMLRTKIYNAPFDVALAKRFNRCEINNIELLKNDKILRITTTQNSSYKKETTLLQFEFTGKHTNVIILNEKEIVLEALRHIDLFCSFREVKVGQKLLPLPKPTYTPKKYIIEDVEQFLFDVYQKNYKNELENLKKQKTKLLEKRLTKLKRLYKKLENPKQLLEEASQYQHYGNLVLTNIQNIKPFSKKITLLDYNNNTIELLLEKLFSKPHNISEYFFTKAKKAKQKAKNLHIEKDSLNSKIVYLENFIQAVANAKEKAKIELLFPKQRKTKQKQNNDSFEIFFIEGYKVLLGKNERGNIEILKKAKAKDIWFHLKDRPSCHVIVSTDKQKVPTRVIESAAMLCVEFSTTSKDRFLVDYTQRRELKVQEGANVLYNNYSTIEVDTRD